MNARDLRLRFAANAIRFALALFLRVGAQRGDFLFEIAELRLYLGGAGVGFGFGFFARGETFRDFLRARSQAADRPV